MPDPGVPDPTGLLPEQDELWVELHRLPPRQRMTVVLRFCEDLSERQTAELMGCSVGSVKKQVSLALAKLRTAMGSRLALPGIDDEAVIS